MKQNKTNQKSVIIPKKSGSIVSSSSKKKSSNLKPDDSSKSQNGNNPNILDYMVTQSSKEDILSWAQEYQKHLDHLSEDEKLMLEHPEIFSFDEDLKNEKDKEENHKSIEQIEKKEFNPQTNFEKEIDPDYESDFTPKKEGFINIELSNNTELSNSTDLANSTELSNSTDLASGHSIQPSWMNEIPNVQWGSIKKKENQRKKVDENWEEITSPKIYTNGTTSSSSNLKQVTIPGLNRQNLRKCFIGHPLEKNIEKDERYSLWKINIVSDLLNTRLILFKEKKRYICVIYHHDVDTETLTYSASIWKKEKGEKFDKFNHLDTAIYRYIRKPIVLSSNKINCKELHQEIRELIYKYGVCDRDD